VALLARVRALAGSAGIVVILLVVAFLAGRKTSTKAPLSTVPKQVMPSSFELVKELNAHAGRLLTLLGLLAAATTFSLGSGAIRDVLAANQPGPRNVAIFVVIALLAMNLLQGFLLTAGALDPAVPVDAQKETEWAQLLESKHYMSFLASWTALVGLMCLGAAWYLSGTDTALLPVHVLLPISLGLLTLTPAVRQGRRMFSMVRTWRAH
jgi:hypothetical protein